MKKTNSKLQYFALICNPKQKEKFHSLLKEYGAHGINTVSARGSVTKSVLAQAFGLDATDKKLFITSLLPADRAKELIKVLHEEYKFDKPNTGIAYTVPVEGLLF